MTRPSAAPVALIAILTMLVQAVPAAGAAEDPRASRAELLVRSAELSDRLQATESEVVAAQMSQTRARTSLTRMRERMRTRAVRAYVKAPDTLTLTVRAPRAYLEVAATKERQLVAGYRSASAEATAEQERAEAARNDLRRTSAELAEVQARLDATIAADDQRRDEEQRRADEARMAAMAAASARAGRMSFPDGPAGTPSPGGYAPSARDPGALLPRHKQATERQLALMRRISFGPLAPGAPLPSGLRFTGQRVVGSASWYGPGFNGRPTASGAIYDQEGWTVASKELPLGTLLLVSRGDRRVLLLVNDRGPYVGDRVLDLSAAAARAVGLGGVGPVTADVVASG
ncbi:MAG: septal ring lytic transglycosylase RlpA family protein [Actinomycetota bacterium]|nr:septal ring lytic transglycosylase RlpA family protein [Actinomycetota bacterium]